MLQEQQDSLNYDSPFSKYLCAAVEFLKQQTGGIMQPLNFFANFEYQKLYDNLQFNVGVSRSHKFTTGMMFQIKISQKGKQNTPVLDEEQFQTALLFNFTPETINKFCVFFQNLIKQITNLKQIYTKYDELAHSNNVDIDDRVFKSSTKIGTLYLNNDKNPNIMNALLSTPSQSKIKQKVTELFSSLDYTKVLQFTNYSTENDLSRYILSHLNQCKKTNIKRDRSRSRNRSESTSSQEQIFSPQKTQKSKQNKWNK